MKRYKFQALVTLLASDAGPLCPELDAAPHRMVLRARSDESGRSEFFSALVSRDGYMPFRQDNPRLLVTLRVIGDDIPEYLDVGRHFNIWLGEDVGEGIVTRRLFV
jgi:hypothetical protein